MVSLRSKLEKELPDHYSLFQTEKSKSKIKKEQSDNQVARLEAKCKQLKVKHVPLYEM